MSFQCELCLRILKEPVKYECCGNNVCAHHIADLTNACPFCNRVNALTTSNTELNDLLKNDFYLEEDECSLKAKSHRMLADLETDINELCAKLIHIEIEYSSRLNRNKQQLMEHNDIACDQLRERLDIEINRLMTFKDSIEAVKASVGNFEVLRNQLDDFFLEMTINLEDVLQFNMRKNYEQILIQQLINQSEDVEINIQNILNQILVYFKN